MVNPELDPGESELLSELRPAQTKSSEYPSGKIRIEELLDMLSCFMCNAGLVITIFAGLMLLIWHKEHPNVRMSRVPSEQTLQMAFIEGSVAVVAGFLFMGALGLFRKWKLWNDDRYLNFVRKACIIIATLMTAGLLVFHIVATFALHPDKSDDPNEDSTPPVTMYVMTIAISLFLLVVVGISMKVMIFNKFGDGFVDDSANAPKFIGKSNRDDNEKTFVGIQ
jgi:uncharacterized membrane protein